MHTDADNIRKKFKELKNTELSCIKALAGYLSGLNSENFCCEKIEMGLGEKTKIVNNLCAPVIFGEDKIIITHEKDKKYDTWLMQDNAVQILYDNVRKGYIEADICMETGIGEDTHAGIIIHDFRGKTYLFGIVRGEFVALYCPQKEQNYLIFEKQNYSVEEGNINKFRIEFNENMVEFFYYDLEKKILAKACTIKISIKDIGLFSKTWENIYHKVTICNIKCNFQ